MQCNVINNLYSASFRRGRNQRRWSHHSMATTLGSRCRRTFETLLKYKKDRNCVYRMTHKILLSFEICLKKLRQKSIGSTAPKWRMTFKTVKNYPIFVRRGLKVLGLWRKTFLPTYLGTLQFSQYGGRSPKLFSGIGLLEVYDWKKCNKNLSRDSATN